jgi:PII-like signaling protein
MEREQTLLRLFLRNTLRYSWWMTAADALIRRAVRRGIMGETTLEAFLGLDSAGNVIEPQRWSLVRERPLVLEFLDRTRAIAGFLTDVVEVVPVGLATLEPVRVLTQRRMAGTGSDDPPEKDWRATLEEFAIMRDTVDGQLLRVFIDDTDTYGDKPLYQAILDTARELGLTSAVVLRAPVGFGSHHRIHTASSPDYFTDLPVLVEITGTSEEIGRLLPFLEQAVPEGLVTLEDVKMLRLGSTPPTRA